MQKRMLHTESHKYAFRVVILVIFMVLDACRPPR